MKSLISDFTLTQSVCGFLFFKLICQLIEEWSTVGFAPCLNLYLTSWLLLDLGNLRFSVFGNNGLIPFLNVCIITKLCLVWCLPTECHHSDESLTCVAHSVQVYNIG